MTTDPETYHDDVLAHLYSVQGEVNEAINTVHELMRSGSKYLATERTKLVDAVNTFEGHPSGCSVCASYSGNAAP